ncbi:unnamed protein product [Acanthoscelides obtectus]|uniref:Death domain-containing protein n=1 Tax=Acanthoscelides obtectus TaxID=200917 RepID=A0A9P0JN30_ACAOB|nr:unnamed protein product [Acanthoscelides obtectus]CAK1628858.1 hypothetical protein AOBTE_LOCUS5434 [Acanthoscelides obtectus]
MSAVTEDSNLTTDAVPNPRDENRNDFQDTPPETLHANSAFFNHKRLKQKLTRLKKTTSAFPGQATIININNSKDVHVGDTIYYNVSEAFETPKPKEYIEENSVIRNLFSSQEPVSRDDILFVSTHVNGTWQDVGRALDYSEGQIEQFVLDHNTYGIKEVIYQLLLDWMQNEPSRATKGNLSKVLWEKDQRSVVKRWSEKFL